MSGGRPLTGPEPLRRRVTVLVTESQYQRWARLADEFGASLSEWLRAGVDLVGDREHIVREGVLLALDWQIRRARDERRVKDRMELRQAQAMIRRSWPEEDK